MSFALRLTEYIEPVLEMIILIISLCSILVLLWGLVKSARCFFATRFSQNRELSVLRQISKAKSVLGSYILFSLELLIITDIIESTLTPSVNGLIRLALIVVIRTTLSFFLQKEIQAHQDHQ